MKRSFLFSAIFLIFSVGAQAQNKTILDAMKDELARSMEKLKLENEAGPYYISYGLHDGYSLRISADSGGVVADADSRNRSLRVDLRVGSYAQDNSNFVSLGGLGSTLSGLANAPIPIDDDYEVIRRQIWQMTDQAYKNALDTLSKKKAAMQKTIQAETLPDFTKGEAISSVAAENSFQISKQPWIQLVDQVSRLLLRPKIQKSKVELTVMIGNSYYINSEGALVIKPSSIAQLSIAATTQAEDGMPLNNFRMYTAQRPEGLPERSKIESDIGALISELMTARSAPLAGEYSGPVLFMGEAAGTLFEQGFGNLFAAKKQPVLDMPQMNAMLRGSFDNPFQNKINLKVAAGFLSVKDAPALKDFNQRPLLGSYQVDDEGVPGKEVSLIENGILKNLLMSRTPVKGMEQSNGHARGGGAGIGVVQVISTNKKSYAQLKQQLIEAAKEDGLEFGYIVRGITPVSESMADTESIQSMVLSALSPQGPAQFNLTKPYSIFRVYPDGREEMVRGVEFGSISINALKNILATSDDETVCNYPVSMSNLRSGLGGMLSILGDLGPGLLTNYATVITPSLLISGIDLKKSGGNYPKLPIVASPIQ
jgi:TldD protein